MVKISKAIRKSNIIADFCAVACVASQHSKWNQTHVSVSFKEEFNVLFPT